ncbi:MAG: hypothetical protein WCT41_02925 [Candidatus Paceibacterota bacterium]|jgi:hypothetical protein
MAKGNGGGFKEGRRSRPAKGGEVDPTQEELQRALARTSNQPTPVPTEVPPRDADKKDAGISAESIQSEREEDALIDKNIEARRAAEAEAVPGATAPDGEQVAGSLVGKFNAFVAAEQSAKNESPITPAVAEAILPGLEHLDPEERKTYEKIPAEKRASYLAHVAEVRADKEKKERKSKNKKPVKHRTQKPKAQSEPVKPLTPMPPEFYEPRPKPDYIAEQLAAMVAKKPEDREEASSQIAAAEKPNPNEDEEYPAVFRYNRDRRGNDEAQAEPPVFEPEISPTPDRTQDWRDGWKKKLWDTIQQFPKNVAGDIKAVGKGVAYVATNPTIESLRAVRTGAERAMAYTKYFMDRNISLNEKGEKLGADLKALTENYNKLPFRQKAYITAALIGGGAVAATAGLPTLSSIFAGGMYTQRALGGAGFALNRRKGMEARIAKNPEHWLANKSDTFKDVYAAVLGGAYLGASAMAGRYATEKVTEWLGNIFGHGAAVATEVASPPSGAGIASSIAPEVPHAAAEGATLEHPAIPAGHQASADVQYQAMRAVETGHQASADVQAAASQAAESSAATVAPEMPSVEASAGHGYEYMVKRVWEQLQDKHIDPSTYAEGSDIRRLLEADAQSIDKVVHQIAADSTHGFFNADGTSVRIDVGAHMTIGADGQIHLGEVVQAPAGAPVTPAFHPEAGAPSAESLTKVTPAEAAEGIVITETSAEPFEAAEPFTAPIETPVAQPEVPVAPAEAPSAEKIQPLPEKEIVSPEPVATIDRTDAPEFVSEPHAETPPANAAEAAATQAPVPVVEQGFISNQLGLKIPVAEPHIYTSPDGALFAYGGSPTERLGAITEYLKQNPGKVVISGDSSGENRIPWGLVDGKLVPGKMMQTRGFLGLGLFTTWMKPPEPDEFKQLIK